jgi:hypothetical protein
VSEESRLLHNQLRSAQDKYTYFILAVAASAIGLSLQEVKDDAFSYSLIPLALANICWGVSFYLGCTVIQYVNSTLYSNSVYLQVKAGQHPETGRHPQMIEAASKGIMFAMQSNSERANSLAHWQFRLLISGALFYISWHLVEMWLRTCN